MNINVDWILLGVKLAAEIVFLTVALCVMLNQQKLPWKFPALFASVLLACALIQIPYAGAVVSFVALLLCITKVIKARTFTDAIVAVGVAFAIFAVFNFLVLNFALGFLHHAVAVRARTTQSSPLTAAAVTNNTLASTNDLSVSNAAPATPPMTAAVPETPSTSSSNTIAVTPITPAKIEIADAPPAEPVFDTNRLNAAREAGDILKHFYVKGTSESPSVNLAMISNGHRNYDIAQGETVQLLTSDGQIADVKCEAVGDGKVVLSVRGVKITIWQK